jgi:basic amino acid/polyamine antiporter, APA family
MADTVRAGDVGDGLAAEQAARAREGLFLRRSSGLVREIGIRDTFGIGAGILVVMGTFSGYAIFLQLLPGTDYYIAIVVGAIISIFLALTYSQLVTTFPRSGGEFIYASRVFTPLLGAMVGGAVLVAILLNGANTAVQISQIYLPFSLDAIGKALSWPGLSHFGQVDLVKHTPAFLTGAGLLLVIAWICTRPVRNATRIVFWTFAVGMVAFTVIILELLLHSRADFRGAFDHLSHHPGAYNEIVTSAKAHGYHPGIVGSAVFSALPLGALIYSGFSFANYAGGELKRPARTYKIAVVGAVTFALLGALLAWAAMRHAAGLHWMQSAANLSASQPDAYGKITSLPPFQGGLAYALILSGDPVTKIVMAIGVLAAFFANGLGYFLLASRVAFALSFDRLLPSKVADVRERTHAPLYAVALVFTGTLALTALGDYTSLITLFRNLVLVVYCIFVIGCVCALLLPWRRKDLYEASPKLFAGRWLGLPPVAILAAAGAASFAVMAYLIAVKPAYSGGYSWDSILTLALTSTIGLLAYAISKLWLRRRGVDLDMAMRELPPE